MTVELSEHLLLQLVNKIEDNARKTPREDLEKRNLDNRFDSDDNPHNLSITDLDQALDQLAEEVADLTEEIKESEMARVELETTADLDPVQEETDENTEHEDQSKEEPEEEDEIECPQCGDTFEKIRGLNQHNTQKDDHVLPTKFFKGADDQYYCFECGDDHESRQSLTTHCFQEHGSKLIEYYLKNFEELREGRVDGIYDYDGNVPELRKEKKVSDCTRDELRRIIPEHLEELDHAQTLNQIALTCFDQELETGSSEYTKLYSCVEEVDSVEKKPDPSNPQRNAYYHETVEA